MNKAGLDKLLSRRKHNGETLGRLLLLSDIEGRRTGKKKFFSEDQLVSILNNLDNDEIRVYNEYVHLYNFLHIHCYIGQGFYQQAVRDFYRLTLIIIDPPALKEIEDMNEAICHDDFSNVLAVFVEALRAVYAVYQLYKDIEHIYALEGLSEAYYVIDNLNGFIEEYNNVLKWAKQQKKGFNKFNPLKEDYLIPSKAIIKKAKTTLRDINVFSRGMGDNSLYRIYLVDKKKRGNVYED